MSFFFVTTNNATRTFIVEGADKRSAMAAACVMMTEEEDRGVRLVELVPVKDEEAAHAHFAAAVEDEDYRDNHRAAYQADAKALAEYDYARSTGCCGSADIGYLVGGFNVYWIGCNFGH